MKLLHLKKHISVNGINKKKIARPRAIFNQQCSPDDWINKNKLALVPRLRSDPQETQVPILQGSILYRDITSLNECDGVICVSYNACEYEDQPSKHSAVLCADHNRVVLRSIMEHGGAANVVGWCMKINHRFEVYFQKTIFFDLSAPRCCLVKSKSRTQNKKLTILAMNSSAMFPLCVIAGIVLQKWVSFMWKLLKALSSICACWIACIDKVRCREPSLIWNDGYDSIPSPGPTSSESKSDSSSMPTSLFLTL